MCCTVGTACCTASLKPYLVEVLILRPHVHNGRALRPRQRPNRMCGCVGAGTGVGLRDEAAGNRSMPSGAKGVARTPLHRLVVPSGCACMCSGKRQVVALQPRPAALRLHPCRHSPSPMSRTSGHPLPCPVSAPPPAPSLPPPCRLPAPPFSPNLPSPVPTRRTLAFCFFCWRPDELGPAPEPEPPARAPASPPSSASSSGSLYTRVKRR